MLTRAKNLSMTAKSASHFLEVGDSTIEYTVRRSRRRKKTVEVSVSQGTVLVSAPARTPDGEIQAMVQKRSRWILEKLAASHQSPPPLRLVSGETLPYLGQELPLLVQEANIRRPSAQYEGERLLVNVPEELPEQERREWIFSAIVAWYKERAQEFLLDSVSRWLPVMGRSETPPVLVRGQRARWGSCSADGTLRFSWRLAMLEPDLIDSVVVHELAHLEVMNHSPAFWDVVVRAMPDARRRRRRLDETGRHLPL